MKEHVDRARIHAEVKRALRSIELAEVDLHAAQRDLKLAQDRCDHPAWKANRCAVCLVEEVK